MVFFEFRGNFAIRANFLRKCSILSAIQLKHETVRHPDSTDNEKTKKSLAVRQFDLHHTERGVLTENLIAI